MGVGVDFGVGLIVGFGVFVRNTNGAPVAVGSGVGIFACSVVGVNVSSATSSLVAIATFIPKQDINNTMRHRKVNHLFKLHMNKGSPFPQNRQFIIIWAEIVVNRNYLIIQGSRCRTTIHIGQRP